jgi:hypothetical protein
MIMRRPSAAPRARRQTFDVAHPRTMADDLVGNGFRCWLTGYMTTDVSCWERVWRDYSTALGAAEGRRAVACLSDWVGAVRSFASREIVVATLDCPTFCRDECMAVSLVAACQQDACPAARACAFALLGNSQVDATIDAAAEFAAVLRESGAAFTSASVQNATASVSAKSTVRH